MAAATAFAVNERVRTLRDPELKEQLQVLRQVENWRNLFSIMRTYLLLALAICSAVLFDQWRLTQAMHWSWDIPVFALAIMCIGAGQHQLTALGHEASHHVLLRHRLANELVSDWLCMFPLFTSTHHYRLQHLAHHQFVNDPERDPNFSQLQVNGHWIHFPMTSSRFWREFFSELLPWNMLNYLRATAMHNAVGRESNPYLKKSGAGSKIAKLVGIVYLFGLMAVSVTLALRANSTVLFLATTGMSVAALIFFSLCPSSWYMQSRIHSAVSIRALSIMRIMYISILFTGLSWLCYAYGPRVYAYAGLLWLLPIFTSFSFFMMMRQLVQHSNGDRGWLTNTRVFLVNMVIRDTVLPYGQDYHVPHHLYSSVPHYNLKKLHEILMGYPEYRSQVLEVANAVVPAPGHEHPTIIEMLGPDYAPAARAAAHVDNSVLDGVEVDEREEIMKAARVSAAKEE